MRVVPQKLPLVSPVSQESTGWRGAFQRAAALPAAKQGWLPFRMNHPPDLITASKGCLLNHLLTQGTAVPGLVLRASAGDVKMKSKGFG